MSDSDRASGELAFGLLGPLGASCAGVALPLGGGRQRAVLALLVCEVGHTVPVERLVDGLWGEAVPPRAVTSVQTYVFHLRQALEPGRARGSPASVVVTVPGGYRLDVDPSCVDMVRFEELVSAADAALEEHEPQVAVTAYTDALSLWRGEVLSDLADYDFVTPLRARLDELRTSARQHRIQAELDLGHHLAVLPEVGVLLSENPLREEVHAQRILALYRSGRQSDALTAYRDLRSVLDTELGIEPSPPLQELHTRVLRQDPTLNWRSSGPAALVVAGTLQTAPPPYVDHGRRPGVYAREGERRRLPALALVATSVAVLASSAGLPPLESLSASAEVPANSIIEIDTSGQVLASVPVGIKPIAVAATPGAIWVVNASDDTVSRVDPVTRAVVDQIDVGHEPRAIAVTGDDLWVTNFRDDTVSRINIEDDREVTRVPVGKAPDAIAVGPAGLWVANSGDNTIQRIDTETGVPGPARGVGDGPDGLAVDSTSVWVANGRAGTVWRVDAVTGHPTSEPIRVGSGPRGIVRLGDAVWVADELSQSVTRISVPSLRPHPIDVGDGPTALAEFDGAVWVAEEYSGDLVRIDPDSEAVDRVDVNAAVHGLATAGGHLWVTSGALPSAQHRGGTLRIAARKLPGDFSRRTLDPASMYDLTSHEATRTVYDGLLAYHYSSADAQVLVPDLATSVPQPTDGGRTYTFNLRPGIRYSTGDHVRASDFVLGVRRALMATNAAAATYDGIIGGRACRKTPASCDLSLGVVPDNATGTVTFHLVAPDPEFLYKLTLLVVPTPPGTPVRQHALPTVPGTGPYQISTYRPGKALTLTRNPYFEQWSAAAQPSGFLDVITWVKVADTRAAADAVEQGRADLAELTPLGERDQDAAGALVGRLRQSRPTHVKHSLAQAVSFAVMNSSVAPFDDLRARRAVNFAVDRRKIVHLLGGRSVARPTCQLMPPTMVSYRRYCPYSTGAAHGDYEGPDLERAKQLVRRSGTRGMEVVVTDVIGDINPPLDAYVAHVLRRIGYHVTLRQLAKSYANEKLLYQPRSGIQVESGGWIADYPLPSNFYAIVACNRKVAGYLFMNCNEDRDRRAAVATQELIESDPNALRHWTRLDRELTDQAVMVPATNGIDWWLTGTRVGNYETGAESLGPLISQLWVQ